MADSEKRTYYIRVGGRIFPGLSIGVIVRNIRLGKLLPEHEISTGKSTRWYHLSDVPEFARYFEERDKLNEEFSENTLHEEAQRYEWDNEGEIEILTRGQLIAKITKFKINEVDRVRPRGSEIWSMAGDLSSFSKFFDQRRVEIKKSGGVVTDYGLPFYIDLMTFFNFFWDSRFLLNLIAIGVFLLIPKFITIPIVAGPISILTNFYLYSYYFRIISATASGHTKFPEYPDFSDFGGELVRPAIQFFLTQTFAALPLLIMTYFVLFGGEISFGDYLFMFLPFFFVIIQAPILTVIFGGAIAGVLVLFAMIYFPISLMRQSTYGEFWPTINIPAVLLSVQRALVPYAFLLLYIFIFDVLAFTLLFLIFLAISASTAWAMTDLSGSAMAFLNATMPTSIEMAIQVVVVVFTFFKMYYIGRYLFQNAERMGWE